MREIKNLVWVFLAAILLATAMAGVGMSSSSVVMYVDPQYSVVAPDGMFDVYVTVSDVVDLFLAELHISFDPALLEVYDDPLTPPEIDIEGINPGVVAPNCEKIHVERLDNEAGWLGVISGRPLGVKTGLTGTVQVAKITFRCKMEGFGDLHLYETGIKNVAGANIDHTTEDGYAINTITAPTLWIRKHGARIYPDWHGGAVNQLQILYAKIVNTGTAGAHVKVGFKIYDATGDGTDPNLWSNEEWVEPGGKVTVQADFTPTIPGKYYVKGALYFRFMGSEDIVYYQVQGLFGGEGTSREPATRFSAT